MPNHHDLTEADRAARAFYGQHADVFAKQVAKICANDERLMAMFDRTRQAYQTKIKADT